MALAFTWDREQNKSVAENRRARYFASVAWRVFWSVCAIIGIVSLGMVFAISSMRGIFVLDFIVGGHIINLGVIIGVLGGMFIARDFVESWAEPSPLSVVLTDKTLKKCDVSKYMSKDALRLIDASFTKGDDWYPWYLFVELIGNKKIKDLLIRLGVNPEDLLKKARQVEFSKHINRQTPPTEKNRFKLIAFKALEIAYYNNDNRVHVGDLFTALISFPGIVRDFMVDSGIREDRLRGANSWLHFSDLLAGKSGSATYTSLHRKHHWRNRLWTSTSTPILDSVGLDMTLNSWQYPYPVARHGEYSLLYEQLSAGNPGVLIVGPKGSGKQAFVEGLAKKILANQVPPSLADRRMVTLSLSRLLSLSGRKTKFKTVVAELAKEIHRSGNIIIFIEDLRLFETTKTDEAAMLVESMLVDVIKSGRVIILSAVSSDEIHNLSGPIVSSFPRIEMGGLNDEATLRVVESKVPEIESVYNIAFTYSALERIVSLSTRYIHGEAQPGKAVSLMTQVSQEASLRAGKRKKVWVTDKEVEQIVSDKTGIPVTQVGEQEQDLLVNLEDKISEKYINQTAAVKSVAVALRRARTQLGSSGRPIANLLFLGPTGVGKTELAKRLAEVYFNGRENMIRLDMSEYQEKQSVRNLIGAPLGVGDGKVEGNLVSAIRKNPFIVVLLDEFEKAHPDILNIFLQVMEDGRLTAPSGETYDFTSSLIIATSNAGAEFIQSGVREGKSVAQISEELKQNELSKHFKPELINRFDSVVVFETLSFRHIVDIAKLLLDKLAQKLAEREIRLDVAPGALRELAEKGYVPEQGARPLRRIIQDNIEDKIARLILGKKISMRDTVLVKEGFTVEVQKAKHWTNE